MKIDMKSVHWKTLAIAVAIPLAVGGLSAALTMGSMETFAKLNQPPLSPPGWLFPVVWSILYVLMGIGSCLVYTADTTPQMRFSALIAYGITLVLNFVWPLLFFRLGVRLVALLWLLILWGFIAVTLSLFVRIRRSAGLCILPYLLWTTFAAYLNAGVYWLNR